MSQSIETDSRRPLFGAVPILDVEPAPLEVVEEMPLDVLDAPLEVVEEMPLDVLELVPAPPTFFGIRRSARLRFRKTAIQCARPDCSRHLPSGGMALRRRVALCRPGGAGGAAGAAISSASATCSKPAAGWPGPAGCATASSASGWRPGSAASCWPAGCCCCRCCSSPTWRRPPRSSTPAVERPPAGASPCSFSSA